MRRLPENPRIIRLIMTVPLSPIQSSRRFFSFSIEPSPNSINNSSQTTREIPIEIVLIAMSCSLLCLFTVYVGATSAPWLEYNGEERKEPCTDQFKFSGKRVEIVVYSRCAGDPLLVRSV